MSKAETFTTTDGAAVASKNKAALAGISRQVEEKRVAAWRGLHPCRERFEREGWPGDADREGKAVQS